MNNYPELKEIFEKILCLKKLEERRDLLLSYSKEKICSKNRSALWAEIQRAKDIEKEVIFLSLLTIGQADHIFRNSKIKWAPLIEIERFYFYEGGIFGYHVKALSLFFEKETPEIASILPPPRVEVRDNKETEDALLAALRSLDSLAFMYPIGGLGDRLNLRTRGGDSLPVALLPFLGRTLLELLIRDVAALEYLYYKFFNRKITIPLIFMTSHVKENDQHIRGYLSQKRWFSRPKKSFFLFSQISVPVLSEEGVWSHLDEENLNFQPGGHGAIWRTADCRGVFDALIKEKKEHLLVRQINNPLASIDRSSLALFGFGILHQKAFGIASCPRQRCAQEGALALVKKSDSQYAISNVEYTDFERLGVLKLIEEGFDLPANTNFIFADLKKILPFIRKNPLPASTFNKKSDVPVLNERGEKTFSKGGRLEAMMQNISDYLECENKENIPSFLTFQPREKIMGAVKRSFNEKSGLLETPEGAFYELIRAGHALLEKSSKLPPFSTPVEYLERGPEVLFLYHPALGPLYAIIQEKIRECHFKKMSELQLEIADLYIEKCTFSGSCLIEAKNVMGDEPGKCYLKNVTFSNLGIDRTKENTFWKGAIKRKEKFSLKIQGDGEFYAEGVHFRGNWDIVVPAKMRWIAYEEGEKIYFYKEPIEKPSWGWKYQILEDKMSIRRWGDISQIISLSERQSLPQRQ